MKRKHTDKCDKLSGLKQQQLDFTAEMWAADQLSLVTRNNRQMKTCWRRIKVKSKCETDLMTVFETRRESSDPEIDLQSKQKPTNKVASLPATPKECTHAHTHCELDVHGYKQYSSNSTLRARNRSLIVRLIETELTNSTTVCVCVCVCVHVKQGLYNGLTHSWSDTAGSSVNISASSSYKQAAEEKGHVLKVSAVISWRVLNHTTTVAPPHIWFFVFFTVNAPLF